MSATIPEFARVPLLELVSKACLSGGERLLAEYKNTQPLPASPSVRLKDPGDSRTIVTAADLESERAIIAVLRRELGCSILSEEAGELPAAVVGSRYRAIIDPLDGTKNFIQRSLGLFGISVAVEQDSELVAGALYLPAFRELLAAERRRGPFLVRRTNNGLEFDQLSPVPSAATRLSDARVCIGRGAAEPAVLSRPPLLQLLSGCAEAVNYASCSVGLASVALKRIDALILPRQKYWDIAAGIVILDAAGAQVALWRESWQRRVAASDLQQVQSTDSFDIVAAGAPDLFHEILQVVEHDSRDR